MISILTAGQLCIKQCAASKLVAQSLSGTLHGPLHICRLTECFDMQYAFYVLPLEALVWHCVPSVKCKIMRGDGAAISKLECLGEQCTMTVNVISARVVHGFCVEQAEILVCTRQNFSYTYTKNVISMFHTEEAELTKTINQNIRNANLPHQWKRQHYTHGRGGSFHV